MDYNYANTLLSEKLEDASDGRIDKLFNCLKPSDKGSRMWNDQVKFWSNLIKNWARETEAIEFSVDKLTQSLCFKKLYPPLKPSIDYLVSIGVLKTHEDVVTTKSFLSSMSSKIFGYIWPRASNKNQNDKYVFVDNLKNKVNSIIAQVEHDAIDPSDVVLSFKELESRFRNDQKYPWDLILNELDRNKRVKKYNNGYYFDVGNFSEFDVGDEAIEFVINIKENIITLNRKLEILDKQINYDLQCAKSFKKQNRIKEAKSSLVHKKMVENDYEKFSKYKANLEVLLNQFEQSHTVKSVHEAMKRGNEAMKQLQMPTVEEVDQVMDEMQDIKDSQDDIVNALQIPEMANLDEEIENDFLNLPTDYDEINPVANDTPDANIQPNSVTFNIYQAPQTEMPQVSPPAKLKTPKQLAQNPIPQYY